MSSTQLSIKDEKTKNLKEFLINLKLLVKGKVLFANVLPVFTGYWLATQLMDLSFNWPMFLLVMFGSTFVVAGALMLNNWYEVDLDEKMKRTEKRPTVTGHFSLTFVLWLGIITTIIGMILVFFSTWEAAFFSFVGWFLYVVPYTFWTKRRFTWNTIIGSASGAVTPLIGWTAVTDIHHLVPFALFMILFVWQVPHTLSITIRRYEEYKAAGVPMLPVVYGFNVTKWHFLGWTIALLPWPFFVLKSIGPLFVLLATILNLYYLYLAVKGFSEKDVYQWADRCYFFSVRYLISTSFLLIILVMF